MSKSIDIISKELKILLVALKGNGRYISLLDELNRQQLLALRLSESFFCPVCTRPVQLKIGTKRVFHFAHEEGAECAENNEPETPYHLKGKLLLYEWLKQQYPQTEIEKYIKEISQRPDIYVDLLTHKYAIEFQCSRISNEIFEKRTKNYLNMGIIPIWILGENWLKIHARTNIKLTPFQWQFASTFSQRQPALYYFCPQSAQFTIASSLLPFSPTKTYCKLTDFKMNKLSLTTLFEKQAILSEQTYVDDWCKEKSKFRINFSIYPPPSLRKLLLTLYENRIPPSLFPAEVGLPVPSMYWIQTPAIIWQLWVLLDSILPLKCGDPITYKQVYNLFNKRIGMKEVLLQKLPLAGNTHYSFAIMEYLQILTKVRILKRIDKTTFVKVKDISIPQNDMKAKVDDELMAKQLKRLT